MSSKLLRTIIPVVSLFVLIFTGCIQSDESTNSIPGVLDITDCALENGTIKITSEWEYYKNKTLSFNTLNNYKPDQYVSLAADLNDTAPTETYRLHVKSSQVKGEELALYINPAFWKYSLYIDDKLITAGGYGNGAISQGRGGYVATFKIPSPEFDIIFNISNNANRGCFFNDFHIGKTPNVMSIYNFGLYYELFIFGALIMTMAFYMITAIFNKELSFKINFALFCLCIVIVADLCGIKLLTKMPFYSSVKTIYFIWLTGATWMGFFLLKYLCMLFPNHLPKNIFIIILVFTAAYQLLLLFAPLSFYIKFIILPEFRLISLLPILHLLCSIYVCITALITKDRLSWVYLSFSVLLLVLTIFISHNRSKTSDYSLMVGLGLLLLIFLIFQIWRNIRQIDGLREKRINYELVFLQSQIKPHFLFNAMNTIISISRNEPDQARLLMNDFDLFFKKSINIDTVNTFVPLEEEIALIQAYLNLEKARFGDRLEFSLAYPENLDSLIPSFILQPIVENAAVHGVHKKLGTGRIDIKIEQHEDWLVFSVKDNGPGFNPKTLTGPNTSKRPHGVGLTNVTKRLSLLYGEKLSILTPAEGGTEITWKIPLSKKQSSLTHLLTRKTKLENHLSYIEKS